MYALVYSASEISLKFQNLCSNDLQARYAWGITVPAIPVFHTFTVEADYNDIGYSDTLLVTTL